MTRKKIIAGNWKMNGNHSYTESLLHEIKQGYRHNDEIVTVVCPPFTALSVAHWLLEGSKIELGAQDVSERDNGAFTGDISAEMLKDIGVRYVIVGHSERRQYHNESDDLVNFKVKKALEIGLIPIICVGESLEQREKNETESVVSAQVAKALAGIGRPELEEIIIAYEPIWAIGTGKTATPEMAQEVHQKIRVQLNEMEPELGSSVSIIYGGSVKPDNAEGLFGQSDIDGALIGGASLEAESFLTILSAVKNKEN